ncbi:hypothetical protein CDAR_574961 [Caerostris darwini]|uniref:Uncharacterized protein n=1 Tax=Caerostris darwini TaxID=1538125 RepID=A0AAV4SXR7_9ARAC|nr:hypothetical protein CDAR_574961 [Caerostris darwini]
MTNERRRRGLKKKEKKKKSFEQQIDPSVFQNGTAHDPRDVSTGARDVACDALESKIFLPSPSLSLNKSHFELIIHQRSSQTLTKVTKQKVEEDSTTSGGDGRCKISPLYSTKMTDGRRGRRG